MNVELSPKVEALFLAVDALLSEGGDINHLTVAQIAERAGIGKGTVYEYFLSKEELLGAAIVYRISAICQKVRGEMKKADDLESMIYCLLDAIDHKVSEKATLLKVVNIITDNSPISREIERIALEHSNDTCMPECILDVLLGKAAEITGHSHAGRPLSYTKLSVAAKLLAYTMFGMTPYEDWEYDAKAMRQQVCAGIMRELGA
ncbi:MAG: TetR/AcrR family transcriptional regulator [Lachnospiraceae bacterium]|jgi:AcrR family transcriptional regulator|nr:TetR/AcrR family transcriptional regulator [Lachnospiraceae bacterium]